MTTPGSSSPTEADWEAAAHARFGPVWRLLRLNDMQRHEVDRIAVALAAEREKARAPFLSLADRLQEQADNWVGWADGAETLLAFADQIDLAAGEAT